MISKYSLEISWCPHPWLQRKNQGCMGDMPLSHRPSLGDWEDYPGYECFAVSNEFLLRKIFNDFSVFEYKFLLFIFHFRKFEKKNSSVQLSCLGRSRSLKIRLLPCLQCSMQKRNDEKWCLRHDKHMQCSSQQKHATLTTTHGFPSQEATTRIGRQMCSNHDPWGIRSSVLRGVLQRDWLCLGTTQGRGFQATDLGRGVQSFVSALTTGNVDSSLLRYLELSLYLSHPWACFLSEFQGSSVDCGGPAVYL